MKTFHSILPGIASSFAAVLIVAPLAIGPTTSMPFDTNVTQLTVGGGGGIYNVPSGCSGSFPVRYVDAGGDITRTSGVVNYGVGSGIVARDSVPVSELPAATFAYVHPHVGLATRDFGFEIGGYAFSQRDPLGYGFGWIAPSALLRVGQPDGEYAALQYLSRTPFASGTIADLGYGWRAGRSQTDWFVGLGMQWFASLPKFLLLDGHVSTPVGESLRLEVRGHVGALPLFGTWPAGAIDVNLGAAMMYQW